MIASGGVATLDDLRAAGVLEEPAPEVSELVDVALEQRGVVLALAAAATAVLMTVATWETLSLKDTRAELREIKE